jgi:hypothetical protein
MAVSNLLQWQNFSAIQLTAFTEEIEEIIVAKPQT